LVTETTEPNGTYTHEKKSRQHESKPDERHLVQELQAEHTDTHTTDPTLYLDTKVDGNDVVTL